MATSQPLEEDAQSLVAIGFTSIFEKDIKALKKKYPRIRDDVKLIVSQIQEGKIPGDQIPGISYPVFKVRLKNSDSQKGTRGGYRLIHYLKTPQNVVLLTIYSKTDQEDITAKQIQEIISNYLKQNPQT